MELVLNLIIFIVAGIVSYYICKWLDRKFRGN